MFPKEWKIETGDMWLSCSARRLSISIFFVYQLMFFFLLTQIHIIEKKLQSEYRFEGSNMLVSCKVVNFILIF